MSVELQDLEHLLWSTGYWKVFSIEQNSWLLHRPMLLRFFYLVEFCLHTCFVVFFLVKAIACVWGLKTPDASSLTLQFCVVFGTGTGEAPNLLEKDSKQVATFFLNLNFFCYLLWKYFILTLTCKILSYSSDCSILIE